MLQYIEWRTIPRFGRPQCEYLLSHGVHGGLNNPVLRWSVTNTTFGDPKIFVSVRLFQLTPKRSTSNIALQGIYNRCINTFL